MSYYYSGLDPSSPTKLEIHYFLENDSHQMDANIRHKCEGEILSLLKEFSEILKIDLKVESEAFTEGGLREKLTFTLTPTHGILISAAIGLLAIYLSRSPKSANPELDAVNLKIANFNWEKLQEEQKAKNEKSINTDSIIKVNELLNQQNNELKDLVQTLKEEIKDDSLSAINKNASDEKINPNANQLNLLIPIIDTSIKAKRFKSNFYKHLNKYSKVESVSAVPLTAQNIPVETPNVILKSEFELYIIDTIELPTDPIENAIIYIISPVLTGGNYKWKGVYLDEIIDFYVKDKDFREVVNKEGVYFKNGFQIECILKFSKIIDDLGNVKTTDISVLTVTGYIQGTVKFETENGKNIRVKKENDANQTKLEL